MATRAHPGDFVGSRLARGRFRRRRGAGLPFRVLRSSGPALGVVLLFVASLAAGAALHLDTPRAREVAAREVNALLAPLFHGRVHLDRVGGLGLFALSRADVTIDDPSGRPVLVLHGLLARVATLQAARSALLQRHGPLTIRLRKLSVDDADVRLDTDPQGRLDLLDALASKRPAAPPDPNARGVKVVVSAIALKRLWGHGHMSGAPPLAIGVRDFAGAFTYSPDAIEGDVYRANVDARRIVRGADVDGSLVAHVMVAEGATLEARLTWSGAVGGIAHRVRAAMARDRIDAVVDVPRVRPADLRRLWPQSTLDRPSRLHLEAHGVLPSVDGAIHAELGEATFDARANVLVGPKKRARLSFESRGIDLHDLAASLPPSRLALKGTVDAALGANGALSGNLALRFLGGRIARSDVPAALIAATVERPSRSGVRAHLDAAVQEPFAPTRLTASLFPKGKSSAIDFELTSESADLGRVPQLRPIVGGSARLRAKGTLDLEARTVDATVLARVRNVAHGVDRLDAADLEARALGSLDAPRIDAAVRCRGIRIAGRRLTTADVTAVGPALSPRLAASVRGGDVPDVDASVELDVRRGIRLKSLRASLTRGSDRARLTADEVRVEGGGLRIEQARLEGAGAPMSADISVSKRSIRVHASTGGLDLGTLARLAYLDDRVKGGTLAFDADVDVGRREARGRGSVRLTGASIGGVRGMALAAELELEGRALRGKAHAHAADIGSVDIDAPNLAIAGTAPLRATSWRDVFGRVGIDARMDLAKAAALVSAVPLGEAGGNVVLRAHVARDDARDDTPEVALRLTTDGLRLAPKTSRVRDAEGVLVAAGPAWRLDGVDFVVDGRVDGQSGDVRLTAQARDAKGDLADLRFETPDFPFSDLMSNRGRLTHDVRTMPLDLAMTIPERRLDGVPEIFKQPYVDGKVRAKATLTGTMLEPDFDLAAALDDSSFAAETPGRPLDFDLAAHYDGRLGSASIEAKSGPTTALDLRARIDAVAAPWVEWASRPKARELPGGGPLASTPPAWRASASAHFDRFPLEAIPVVGDERVSGSLSGDLQLTGLHQDAHARAALSIDGLKVGSVAYASARVDAAADGRAVDATLRVDQTDGFAEARAHAAARWGAALAPSLDPSEPADLALRSKNFRLAVLLPFVESSLDELDGRIDSDARLELDPRTRGAKLSGRLALRRAAVEAVAGGGELHDISADVRFSPDGTIAVENLTASGLSGRLEARATAHLAGLTLRSAEGVIVIPGKSAIPVSAGGIDVGTVDGRIDLRAAAANGGRATTIDVTVPHLRVALSEASTTSAMALGPTDPRIRIGAQRGRPATFVDVPLDPPVAKPRTPSPGSASGLTLVAHLVDVQVVRGTQLNVDLDGTVGVRADGAAKVTGQIHLKRGGTLFVQGRKFTVEEGTVTLLGADPSNPEVVVKAAWTAPDGTVVVASFVGPLKTGKVTLQSEPRLPRQQIVQLLLYGTQSGPQVGTGNAPATSPESSAIATVGGEAAQPLNHMFNQLGMGSVSAHVDTSQSANPKPEVEVQVSREISLQIAYVLGVPPPGVNPDHTLLTVEYRFLSHWSLASTVGDAGTTIIDLLWQRTY